MKRALVVGGGSAVECLSVFVRASDYEVTGVAPEAVTVELLAGANAPDVLVLEWEGVGASRAASLLRNVNRCTTMCVAVTNGVEPSTDGALALHGTCGWDRVAAELMSLIATSARLEREWAEVA